MTVLAALALLAWIYLALLHGRFWQSGPVLPAMRPRSAPGVAIVVPARDEAMLVAESVGSLLRQDYAGSMHVILVDDASSDGTAARAEALDDPRVRVLRGRARPPGWAGKLWAVHQGVVATDAPWLLLTDADIVHEPAHLASLMAKAEALGADMVSEMVALRCRSTAERWLVPAFVYFFQLLYPFAQVNNPTSAVAAAAGGTVLLRRAALDRVGGIASIRGALIDDVALAARIKPGGRIWLGHSALARSVRPYPGPGDIWRMIARSAYVQLRLSPALLVGTVIGLLLVFIVPVAAAVVGHGVARVLGLAAWAIMAASFVPTVRRFALSPLRAAMLPAAALFYVAATIGSALAHHRGGGVVWKNRAYAQGQT